MARLTPTERAVWIAAFATGDSHPVQRAFRAFGAVHALRRAEEELKPLSFGVDPLEMLRDVLAGDDGVP